ncbi:MAG: hypothetical protein NTV17_16770 [Burkholderiales bacterium]|nr:hypothetical protein [Burkholderiales bacterium]
MSASVSRPRPVQRIVKVRRDYNRWVADETLEDYALRYAPKGFRKWSEARVAHTAFGGVSFLALEAIGATLALNYGFMNAVWAIAAVSLLIFLTGLPIAYRAAREGLDMDLLSRGTGFGYLGATLTSLIYASFTFIFFAIEAAIMAQGLELWFGLPRMAGYVVSALIVIPVVVHGVTAISRLQVWTQPLWLALLVLPFLAIALHNPGAFIGFTQLEGRYTDGPGFSWIAFGAAAAVAASLIAQIGEQVDFLRFMPEATRRNRVRWWAAVIIAGPGWIVLGALKMLAGAFLAFLALQHAVDPEKVFEPTQLYLVGFGYVVGSGSLAVALTGLFVVVSQVKINVTNAYAGSLAWSNFFARLTHSHPGRVVWLVFNVAIALLLMMLGVFEALEKVLGFYAHLALAWVGAIVGDLVLSKPLGLSPARIEFRRAICMTSIRWAWAPWRPGRCCPLRPMRAPSVPMSVRAPLSLQSGSPVQRRRFWPGSPAGAGSRPAHPLTSAHAIARCGARCVATGMSRRIWPPARLTEAPSVRCVAHWMRAVVIDANPTHHRVLAWAVC